MPSIMHTVSFRYGCIIEPLWKHMIYLLVSFRVASQALGLSHDCPSAGDTTLNDMGKIDQYQTTTKHNKAQYVSIFLCLYCTVHT